MCWNEVALDEKRLHVILQGEYVIVFNVMTLIDVFDEMSSYLSKSVYRNFKEREGNGNLSVCRDIPRFSLMR